MKTAKTSKTIFWIATIIIFVMEGVIPALTSQTELAKEGIKHLGYPEYFGNALVIFKIGGVIILLIPNFPNRIKEWAYAGFAFNFIFACISHWVVDGFGAQTLLPIFFSAVLIISYISYQKVRNFDNNNLIFQTNEYVVSSIP